MTYESYFINFHSPRFQLCFSLCIQFVLFHTYRDQHSSFESLLEKDSSKTIHVKNLKVMLPKMFKTKNCQNPDFMREVNPLRNNTYKLRYNNKFLQPKVKTVSYGLETIRVRGLKLWQTLPSHIKSPTSLKDFKRKV